LGWIQLSEVIDCSKHARTSRQTVVDENHDLGGDLRWGSFVPVGTLPPKQLTALLLGDALDNLGPYTWAPHNVVIDDDNAAARNRPHCQLLMAGDAELAN
jgi:hypothetical protein